MVGSHGAVKKAYILPEKVLSKSNTGQKKQNKVMPPRVRVTFVTDRCQTELPKHIIDSYLQGCLALVTLGYNALRFA